MNYRGRQKRRKDNKMLIGIIITLSIIISIYLLSIINVPLLSKLSSKIVYGIDSIVGSVTGFISQGTSYFGNTKKLNTRIEELENELEKTKISIQEISLLETENKDLKEMLKIKEEYNHFEKIYATVITRSYDNWNETFVINKGRLDGIKEKQTVIAADGLVGYISKVEDNTSVVTTILDTSSAVSIEISNINALALVKGNFSLKNKGKIKLVNIPINAELSKGDKVYSSGIGELYKKGIPIGAIEDVVNKKNDIDRYAIIDVFANIDSLDVVGIIVNWGK